MKPFGYAKFLWFFLSFPPIPVVEGRDIKYMGISKTLFFNLNLNPSPFGGGTWHDLEMPIW